MKSKLVAYVYIRNTEVIVAKIEAENDDDLTIQLLQAIPTKDYEYRIDRRIKQDVKIWR